MKFTIEQQKKLDRSQNQKKSITKSIKTNSICSSTHKKQIPNQHFQMSTFPSTLQQNYPDQSNDKDLFKGFQNEQPQQENNRLDSISNLINILKHKKESQAQGQQSIQQKKSDSQDDSISNPSQKSISRKHSLRFKSKENLQVSFRQAKNEKFYQGSGSKPKSKFAKLHQALDSEEPHIITSSYKSLFSPSKSSTNINSKSNQPSNFLSPGNNFPLSKKQLTSAVNLVQQEENQPGMDQKTNRSAFGNKSISSQIAKQTTFAALPSKRSQEQQNSNGFSLYEEVLTKNFEVIDNLLRKINQIYSNQQDYENSLIEITEKLHKIEADNENIHHEFRTSHFMIDKKLNSITNEYSNMLHDMNLLKKMFKEGNGRGSFFVGLQGNSEDDDDSNLNSRRRSTQRHSSKRNSGRTATRKSNFSIERKDSLQNSHQHRKSIHRRSTKKNLNMSKRSSNWTNLKVVDEQNQGKIFLEQINESVSWQGSQSDFSDEILDDGKLRRKNTQESQQSMHDERLNISKNNGHQKRSRQQSKVLKNGKRISIDNFGNEDINVLKSYISQEVIKMSQNSEINRFTILGIETLITKKFEAFEEKLDEKLFQFKKQVIEERIEKQFRKSIIDEMEQKTIKMIEKDISSLQELVIERISILQKRFNREMERKCDKQEFRQDLKEILESMNRKVNTLMDECYHKFAERNESKRAILFLEKKINKLVETAHKFKNLEPTTETGDNAKCLSCSKNVPAIGGHHQTQSQPMFTQLHCIPPQQKDQNGFGNDFTMTMRKNEPSTATQKRKVKFTDITNLNYASVGQIFDKTNQPAAEQIQAMNRLMASSVKQGGEILQSSKQAFMKKFKNAQTANSAHFGSVNSHLKTKFCLNTNQNRPTSSMNASVHETKNWKSKATSILKKEGTGVDWRSKSHYKKAA